MHSPFQSDKFVDREQAGGLFVHGELGYKTGNVHINLTLRRVRVTIVVVESQ
jgi:hypothetical protein